MRFKINETIKNISIYSSPIILDKERILFINLEHQLMLKDEGSTTCISEDIFGWLRPVEQDVFCFDQTLMKTLVFSRNNHSCTYLDFVANPMSKATLDSTKLFFRIRIKDEHGFAFVDIKEKKILDKYPNDYGLNGIKELLNNNLFLSWNEESIAGCNLSDGSTVWQKKYKELLLLEDAEQSGNIIYHQGKIYLVLHSRENSKSTTFCLDETTGAIIEQYPDFGGFFRLSGDIIFRAHNYTVGTLDTKTNITTIYDFKDSLEPEKLWIHNRTSILSSEGLIYFVDGATITGSRFGILDLKSHKLLWYHKLKIQSRYKCINSLQLSGNRLYVHADDDTLHIFERE